MKKELNNLENQYERLQENAVYVEHGIHMGQKQYMRVHSY